MSGPARLPAHLAVAGLLRAAEAGGGFGMVIHRGERDAGPILVVLRVPGVVDALYERLPRTDGSYPFVEVRSAADDAFGFDAYLARRRAQDPDTWIVELEGRLVADLIHSLDL